MYNVKKMLESWNCIDNAIYTIDDILDWIYFLNNSIHVNVLESDITNDSFWFYDDYTGEILNRKRSFFSIRGVRWLIDEKVVLEQPMIIQPEIGYLGIIIKEIDGMLYFLMQAKIEPGNINCVQISPTLQATKSNFLRTHGGKVPAYFEYFENYKKYKVIYDQIQSEQGKRFKYKRNRNIIIEVEEDVEVLPNFRWMTLGQIKYLMHINNLVNMDTRTVLSGLPFLSCFQIQSELKDLVADRALYTSMFERHPYNSAKNVISALNDYKMYTDIRRVDIPLYELKDWEIDSKGVRACTKGDFEVAFYAIEIEGREVQCWSQPLLKSSGIGYIGLFTMVQDGVRKFLVKITPEVGIFDKVEIGPTILCEPTEVQKEKDYVEDLFYSKLSEQKNIVCDVLLSEEGGRFYHEQNRNIIIEIETGMLRSANDLSELGYFWVDYAALNLMVLSNNVLNIQLRNLISLFDLSFRRTI